MKKYLLILLLLTGGTYVAKAQLQKGNVLVGADLSNFQLYLDKGGAFSMRIDPKAAWFVKDNTAIGGYFNFQLQTGKSSGTYTNYGLGVLGRQYMSGNAVASVGHTRLFVEANLGIEGANNNLSGIKTSTNGLGLGIGPGLAYFITPNIGLEGLLKYNGIVGFGTTPKTSYLNLGVGFQVYLPGRTVKSALNNTQ
jgi:hypothetical protein